MGIFDKAIPNYVINDGKVVITKPEDEIPYIDDIFDPVFNKSVREALLARSNGSFGTAMVRGYGELLKNTFTGHNDQWGIFGPGMGILSTFGRSMDKAGDFILGAMTESIKGLSEQGAQNPLKRIFVEDQDYTGKGLLAAATNAMSPLVGGARVDESDFKGLWNVPGMAVELATDPGIMGGAVSRRLLPKTAQKATASELLANLGKADAKTAVGTAAKLLSDYDDIMTRIAIDATAPGLRPLIRKFGTRVKHLVGTNNAAPYADAPLHDYRGVENTTPTPPPNSPGGINDAAKHSGSTDNTLSEMVSELNREYVNAQRKLYGEELEPDLRTIVPETTTATEVVPETTSVFDVLSKQMDTDQKALDALSKEFENLVAFNTTSDALTLEYIIKKYANIGGASKEEYLPIDYDTVESAVEELKKTSPEFADFDAPKIEKDIRSAEDAVTDAYYSFRDYLDDAESDILPDDYKTFEDWLGALDEDTDTIITSVWSMDTDSAVAQIKKCMKSIEGYKHTLESMGDYPDVLEELEHFEDSLYDSLSFIKNIQEFYDKLEYGEGLFNYSGEYTKLQKAIIRANQLKLQHQPIITVRNSIRKHPEVVSKAAEGIAQAIKVSFDDMRLKGIVPYNPRELAEALRGSDAVDKLVGDMADYMYFIEHRLKDAHLVDPKQVLQNPDILKDLPEDYGNFARSALKEDKAGTRSIIDLYDRLLHPKQYKNGVYAAQYVDDATEFVKRVDRAYEEFGIPKRKDVFASDLKPKTLPDEDETLDVFENLTGASSVTDVPYIDRQVIDSASELLDSEFNEFIETGAVGDNLSAMCNAWLSESAKIDLLLNLRFGNDVPEETIKEVLYAVERAHKELDARRVLIDMRDLADRIRPFTDLGASGPVDNAINNLLKRAYIPEEKRAAFFEELARTHGKAGRKLYRPRVEIRLPKGTSYHNYSKVAENASGMLDALISAHAKNGGYWNNTIFEYNGVKYVFGDKVPYGVRGVKSLKKENPIAYNILRSIAKKNEKGFITGFSPYNVEALHRFAAGDFAALDKVTGELLITPDVMRHAYGMADALMKTSSSGNLPNWYGVFTYNGKKYSLGNPAKLPPDVLSVEKVAPQTYEALMGIVTRNEKGYIDGVDDYFFSVLKNHFETGGYPMTEYAIKKLKEQYAAVNVPEAVQKALTNSLNVYARDAMVKAEVFSDIDRRIATIPALSKTTTATPAVADSTAAVKQAPTITLPESETVNMVADKLAEAPKELPDALQTINSVNRVTVDNCANVAINAYRDQLEGIDIDPEKEYSLYKLIADAATVKYNAQAGKTYYTKRVKTLVGRLSVLKEGKSPIYKQLKEVIRAVDTAAGDVVKGSDWLDQTIKAGFTFVPKTMTPEAFEVLTQNVKKVNATVGDEVLLIVKSKLGGVEVPTIVLNTSKRNAVRLFSKYEKTLTAEGFLADVVYEAPKQLEDLSKKYPEAKKLFDEWIGERGEYYKMAGIPYTDEFVTHVRSVDPTVAGALRKQLYGDFTDQTIADVSDMSNTIMQQIPAFRKRNYGALGTSAYGRRFRGSMSAWNDIGITSTKQNLSSGITEVTNHPIFKDDPLDIITGSFGMGTMHNSEFQSFIELFQNDNFKVKNYFRTPDELREVFYREYSAGRASGNATNLVLASPRFDESGKLIGFKRYSDFSQKGLEAALKDPECVLLPNSAFARMDAICKKEARMSHWWFRTVSKLTTPFKIGCLVNPGFLLGNASDAMLKQAVTMADQYGTSVTEELANLGRAYADVQVLNNRFAEVFDKYIEDVVGREGKVLDVDRSYQSLLYSGSARKRFDKYVDEVYKAAESTDLKKVAKAPKLSLEDIQIMQLWQFINSKLPTMSDNLQDLGDVAAKSRRVTGKFSNQNVIERILYGGYSYDPKHPKTWGLLSKNPLVEGVMSGSEYIEQSVRATAILNDLRHRGISLDDLEDMMGSFKSADRAAEAARTRVLLEDALNAMNAANFDYDNVGDLLNAATYAMPFPTFYMKNIVFWMDLIEKNPKMIKNLLKTQNAVWDVSESEEDDEFVAEAKGRGALAFGDVDSERPLGKFFKGIYKPTPLQSMFGAFSAIQNPMESLTARVNPLFTAPVGAIAGSTQGPESELTALLGGTDSVKYRPYNMKRFQKNMRAGDEDFNGLRYMFHRINPFDRAINNALRIPEKAKHGEMTVADLAPSVFQPRFK